MPAGTLGAVPLQSLYPPTSTTPPNLLLPPSPPLPSLLLLLWMPADGPHSVARHLLPPAPATHPPLPSSLTLPPHPCRQQLPTIPLCLSRAAHRTGGFRTDHFTPRCPRQKGGCWGKCVLACVWWRQRGPHRQNIQAFSCVCVNKNNTRTAHACTQIKSHGTNVLYSFSSWTFAFAISSYLKSLVVANAHTHLSLSQTHTQDWEGYFKNAFPYNW